MTNALRVDAADLVASVPAATRLADLDRALAAEGVWLALDPPGSRETTIGAALERGDPGPLAALYGPPRDQVIGLSFTGGDGTAVKTGGRVVKNVSGFDLAKLVIGGRRAFGAITEAHVRLRAAPQADRTRAFVASADTLAGATARLLRSGAMLGACEIASPDLAQALGAAPGWTMLVRALGTSEGVDEELAAAEAAIAGGCASVAVPDACWRGWSEAVGSWPATARIGADPSAWRDAVLLAESLGATAFTVTVPRGIVRARFAEGAGMALAALRAHAARRRWPVTIERADEPTLRDVGIWGAMDEGAARIAVRLRAALGPAGTQAVPRWAEGRSDGRSVGRSVE